MNSEKVRQQFLDFFKSKGHKVVPSSPMVNKDDPTLLFTNAGMNQFKEYFLGHSSPKSNRVADTQKCLRVSGKHNDLEEVGVDTYHHTFFEMLGNWSFGDYFKKEAIEWAWELLTEVYKIDPSILYVTVFEGHEKEKLKKDEEAYAYWKEILPEERILLGNKKDNFWEMGEQGPCGPCSEIHIDIRSEEEKVKQSGAELVNQDHPQVIEVWNLVFMEFNRKVDGSLEKLPAQHVDTGMGFERLCMVLQNKTSNYDTDVFSPLIKEIEKETAFVYGKNEETDRAIRVVADHLRTVFFAIADGQLPSNTGAGYVIRRILRRAIRYGYTFLSVKTPFIYKLTDTLSEQMSMVFPELKEEHQLAKNVIKEEEVSFLKTLDQGLLLLDNLISKNKGKILLGESVFELYDTYGFPLDLTALIAREKGFSIDEEGFEKAMAAQKKRSREASDSNTGDWIEVNEKEVEGFVGYDTLNSESTLLKYRSVESKKQGRQYQLIFEKTPFYPEGGGQVGDKGYLETSSGMKIQIIDTKKENNLLLHFTTKLPDELEQKMQLVVNGKERAKSSSNHTATHLMHQALREILGTHVEQKGSMVNGKSLRFDFSHFSKVSKEQLELVEQFVNDRIREKNVLEENREVPFEEAKKQGGMALFGEKYGDTVRTIRFGESMELCGGTHVQNTADIWYFKILSESAVASGIRRIEAITGEEANVFIEKQESVLNEIKELLKTPQSPTKAIENLIQENTVLKKELERFSQLQLQTIKADLNEKLATHDTISFLAEEVDLPIKSLKDLVFEMGKGKENLFLVLATQKDDKVGLVCYISKELAEEKKLNASSIIKEISVHIQGGGGGQPFFASSGGKRKEGIPQALEEAKLFLTNLK